MNATLVSELDDSQDLYCGNCGMDYTGMTVGQLREIVDRRECPACTQYLADLTITDPPGTFGLPGRLGPDGTAR